MFSLTTCFLQKNTFRREIFQCGARLTLGPGPWTLICPSLKCLFVCLFIVVLPSLEKETMMIFSWTSIANIAAMHSSLHIHFNNYVKAHFRW